MVPIHYAVILGSSSVVEALIEAGAGIDVADTLGRTALLWAISKGHTDIVTRLWKDSRTKAT
jgi:ankyrin repeat protein